MVFRMRGVGLFALAVLAVGCGRSDLLLGQDGTSVFDEADAGADGGSASDSSLASDSSSIAPDDATVLPPPPAEDATLPPPEDDAGLVTPPPVDDALAPCGPSTCTGCCRPDGSCLSDINGSDGLCGAHGEQCIVCNQTCLQGGCGNPVSNCGPGTCDGCCAGGTICADGKHDTACGHGGVQCESCNPTTGGGQCILQTSGIGGQCQFPTSTCNANTCPLGCCAGNVCAQGTQDIACGKGGTTCVDCTANGTTCLVSSCAGGFPANGSEN